MTDQRRPELDWAPEACTLPTAEQPLRLAEFDALFTAAVRDAERLEARRLRVMLSGDTGLEAAVRDLTERETQCCSFFSFAISAGAPGMVRLDIEVPAGHVEVLDALQARAAAVRGGL
jgi:hypothetical protein